MPGPLALLETVGDGVLRFLRYVGGIGALGADSFRAAIVGPFRGRPVHGRRCGRRWCASGRGRCSSCSR